MLDYALRLIQPTYNNANHALGPVFWWAVPTLRLDSMPGAGTLASPVRVETSPSPRRLKNNPIQAAVSVSASQVSPSTGRLYWWRRLPVASLEYALKFVPTSGGTSSLGHE
ncbi:hypothetical protein GCM10007392_22180 [Saccharospirillum salsuginis]|uniref:Uncharacterized protein n=1 Tax=Saccharospirillum salsuginis TaxID=418750 RepID=A0A918K8E9_9GAMM|nr:hypothetical protein GCM10007392_22180 [Saccharospirillum salsuginis]